MSRFGKISLEDGDVENPEVAVPEQEGDLAGDNTVEAGLIEVQEAEVEVAADEAKVEQLEADQAALESLLISMESSLADGGLTAGEAVYAQHALQAIVGKYGVDASKTVSVESFGVVSSRRQATVSMENAVSDWIKSIWEKIKSFFKKMWAKVRNWYEGTWATAPRLRARAEAIKKKASDLQGSIDKKDFDLGLLSQLHVGGKYPADLRAEFGKAADAIVSVLTDKSADEYEALADSLIKVAETIVESKDADAGGKMAAVIAAGSGIVKSGSPDKRYSDKLVVVKSAELLGGKMSVRKYVSNKVASAGELADAIASSGASVDTFAEKAKELPSGQMFKTLEKGTIENLAQDVAKLCNSIMDFKKQWEGRNAMEKRIIDAGDRLEKEVAAEKELKESAKREITGAMRAITRIGLAATKQGSAHVTYGLNTGKAILTACERSLGQYKKA